MCPEVYKTLLSVLNLVDVDLRLINPIGLMRR